jgi:hypothetical protein
MGETAFSVETTTALHFVGCVSAPSLLENQGAPNLQAHIKQGG